MLKKALEIILKNKLSILIIYMEPILNIVDLKKEMKRQYYIKNKDAIQTRNREYYSKNKDAIIHQICERIAANPEKKKKENCGYYTSNKKISIEQAKQRYQDNKNEILLKNKMKCRMK